jgi:hypothetical protein
VNGVVRTAATLLVVGIAAHLVGLPLAPAPAPPGTNDVPPAV